MLDKMRLTDISKAENQASGAAPSEMIGPTPEMYDRDDSDNRCFLCEDPRYAPYLRVDQYGFPFEFKQCACGSIKQTPMPNEAFFEWFFNSDVFFSSQKTRGRKIWGYHDYFADEPNRLATSRWRYRRFKEFFPDGGPLDIMKIGPSTGTFLHVAKLDNHRVFGCDVSDRFRGWAKEHYGIQVDQGRFENLDYRDDQFDVILLLSVLENVPNQSEFLNAIHDRLKPGGIFIFNYVDMHRNLIARVQKERYSLFRPPICYVFDRFVVSKILRKFGFNQIGVLRDLRIMNVEKILTLFGWRRLWSAARVLRLNRLAFPVYAYPSRIVIAKKTDDL